MGKRTKLVSNLSVLKVVVIIEQNVKDGHFEKGTLVKVLLLKMQ